MKALFAGGGTMGPVTPLLAVIEAWRGRDKRMEAVWVGTKHGPEREVMREQGIAFLHLPVARLPRYPTLEWLLVPLRFAFALALAWLVIGRENPDVIVSAGGFTGVPLVIIGRLRGIPSLIHQPDVEPLLANRLAAPFASRVTVAWKETADAFPARKTRHIGNPVRPSVLAGTKDRAFERFGIDLQLPTLLVFGGGGGAAWLNRMMLDNGKAFAERANVIHITGRDKHSERYERFGRRYQAVPFLSEGMADAIAAADVVVARAGMGTITELSAMKKAAVLIPIPGSAQEANARALARRGAAEVRAQTATSVGDLKAAVLGLLDDKERRREIAERIACAVPTDVSDVLIDEILLITKTR